MNGTLVKFERIPDKNDLSKYTLVLTIEIKSEDHAYSIHDGKIKVYQDGD